MCCLRLMLEVDAEVHFSHIVMQLDKLDCAFYFARIHNHFSMVQIIIAPGICLACMCFGFMIECGNLQNAALDL